MKRRLRHLEQPALHFGLWGLHPGHEISPRLTPELAEASRVVLEQRGLTGNGWSSAWKAAC